MNAKGEKVPALKKETTFRDYFELKRGEYFRSTAVGVGQQRVTRAYRDAGYAYAQVIPVPKLHPKKHLVDLTVQVVRGAPVYIERIEITGNTKTMDSVIRREMTIFEGQLYSQSKLEFSRAQIQRLGYFENVSVAEQKGRTDDRMVVTFTIVERATGTFNIGAGFSSIEQFVVTAQVQEQNFLGRGHALQLQLQLSAITQNINFQYVEPWLFDTRWLGAVSIFHRTSQNRTFVRNSTGFGLRTGHPIFDPRLNVGLGYNFEYNDIGDQTGAAFSGIGASSQGFQIFNNLPLRDLYREGLTSSLRLSLTWDSRDDRINTKSGFFTSHSIELAEQWLGSDLRFIRHNSFFRWYKHIWGPFTFRFNFNWNTIHGVNQTVPIYQRPRLGGIMDVRGFPFFTLGPRAGLPNRTRPDGQIGPRGVQIGGNVTAYYNVEIEFPIVESLGLKGVVFTDGGNAWNTDSYLCQVPQVSDYDVTTDPCRFNPWEIRASVGFGVRWFSPFGPLRFEFGIPLDKRSHEEALRFDFTIGQAF